LRKPEKSLEKEKFILSKIWKEKKEKE